MLRTIEKSLSSLQLRELKKFGSRVNRFGVNFAVFDVECEPVLLCEGDKLKSDREQLIKAGRQALKQSGDESYTESEVRVCRFDGVNQILAVVLKSNREAVATALIDLGEKQTDSNNLEQIERENYPLSEMLSEMLCLSAEKFQAETKAEEQIEMVSTELAQTYEELVLLHKLGTNMKVTESDSNFLQMACDNLTDIISVEGIAILLEKTVENEKQMVLSAGLGLIDIDEQMSDVLKSRLMEEINSGKEALLDSEVDSPFKYDWEQDIKNIIVVPLWKIEKKAVHFGQGAENNNSIIGMMVAINRIDKPDFDSTDVKLFNSVANECAVFIENGRLFKDLKELFIGSLKALTSSIDAKDQYTRGHSERVAFISRWIAERLAEEEPLKEEQIHKIYLAGLLHDIGKMGIDESILRKKGKLTEEEFEHIRTHSLVGAKILSEIKQMRDIVPGILSHHERVDGKGYPNGLVGEQIPLTGKIIGLADCFDAMTSKRVYRNAMTVEETLLEIERGLGSQFDEKVGRAFINSDVYQLWEIMQEGFSGIYGSNKSVEYGAVAVGSIIR
jgi:putative nucleotidyltransferase with HDIG domain